jgi:hypothetical protein
MGDRNRTAAPQSQGGERRLEAFFTVRQPPGPDATTRTTAPDWPSGSMAGFPGIHAGTNLRSVGEIQSSGLTGGSALAHGTLVMKKA